MEYQTHFATVMRRKLSRSDCAIYTNSQYLKCLSADEDHMLRLLEQRLLQRKGSVLAEYVR